MRRPTRALLLALALLGAPPAVTAQAPARDDTWPRRVLITNDDGIDSVPMQALARAFAAFAEVYVVAPAGDRSGTGSTFSAFRRRRFYLTPVDTIPGVTAWSLDGYPADCVLFGLMGGLGQQKPDLVITGPNGGANLGESWIASGTLGAARVAAYFGVPAIAVSGVAEDDPGSVAAAAEWTVALARSDVARRLRAPQYLNVNIPVGPPEEVTGIAVVRSGRFIDMLAIRDTASDVKNNRENWVLASMLQWDSGEPGTDVDAYAKGEVSIQAMRAGERDPGLDAWLRQRMELLPPWPGLDDETAAAGAGEPASDTALAEREIRAELMSYYADMSARNWDAYADHFWPGATLTSVWQPPGEPAARVVATTVPEFVAQAPEGPGSRQIFQERMLGAEIRVHGDLAHVWAHYEARFGDPGDVSDWRGIDAFTFMKHDGRWRITALAYTTETP